ncbi:MAG: hypothetical protein KC912_15345 [Proteobacteria bacterium]|nr:hypothetical protein [Pseudomonadota bacterium]
MFLLLALSTASAADASLRVDSDHGVYIEVDGVRWAREAEEPNTTVGDTEPGRREVRVISPHGRVLYTGLVDVPSGYEVRCTWTNRAFDCPQALAIHQPEVTPTAGSRPFGIVLIERTPTPVPEFVDLVVRATGGTWTDVVVDGLVVMELRNSPEGRVRITPGRHTLEFRDFMSDRGWATGQIDTRLAEVLTVGVSEDKKVTFYDSRGWLTGGGQGVPSVGRPNEMSTTAVVIEEMDLASASLRVESFSWTPAAPAAVVPDEVTLRVRSRDGEWADVLVDGKVVLEIRNSDEESVQISPGRHTIEVREFMEEEPYTSGTLETGVSGLVTLGIEEGKPTVAYDHDGWQSR